MQTLSSSLQRQARELETPLHRVNMESDEAVEKAHEYKISKKTLEKNVADKELVARSVSQEI